MGLSYSTDKTDETGKELLTYGTADFPIAFFDDDLTIVKVPWHWHDELEIVVILSGEVRAFIAGCELNLKADEDVLKYRLEQIRDELSIEPDSSIAEIAYSCGFNDISYFNRCFLKAYGETPSSYKNTLSAHS